MPIAILEFDFMTISFSAAFGFTFAKGVFIIWRSIAQKLRNGGEKGKMLFEVLLFSNLQLNLCIYWITGKPLFHYFRNWCGFGSFAPAVFTFCKMTEMYRISRYFVTLTKNIHILCKILPPIAHSMPFS